MNEYNGHIEYYPCAYCEEIINILLSKNTFLTQYQLTTLLKRKMNAKTTIRHIEELINDGVLVDFSNPPLLLFDEIRDTFMEKSNAEYGKPVRKGMLNFAEKRDLTLLMKIIEGSQKRQRRRYVLWFDYDWLVSHSKTSTSLPLFRSGGLPQNRIHR